MVLIREGLSREGSKVQKATAQPCDLQRPLEVSPQASWPGPSPACCLPHQAAQASQSWGSFSQHTLLLPTFTPSHFLSFCLQGLPHSYLIWQILPELLRFTWSFPSFMRSSLDTSHRPPPTQLEFITPNFLPSGQGILTHASDSWVKGASLMAQMVKNLPATQEVRVRSLGGEDPLEKGMATRSSILAWRIPRTEEPGGL